MEALEHTPGPWGIVRHLNRWSINGAKIMAEDCTHVASVSHRADKPIDQKEADALLIAAAPDLVEHLGKLIAAIEWEVPPIRDGVDADERLSILLRCADEAKAAYLLARPGELI